MILSIKKLKTLKINLTNNIQSKYKKILIFINKNVIEK